MTKYKQSVTKAVNANSLRSVNLLYVYSIPIKIRSKNGTVFSENPVEP